MNQLQIDNCKNTWSQKLNFLVADVEHLSEVVPKNTIDYLVDVESSFLYPNKTAYLREVREVLKDNGMFYFGAILPWTRVAPLTTFLRRWFDVQREEDITANVLLSLKLDTVSINNFIDNHYPWCKNTITE